MICMCYYGVIVIFAIVKKGFFDFVKWQKCPEMADILRFWMQKMDTRNVSLNTGAHVVKRGLSIVKYGLT